MNRLAFLLVIMGLTFGLMVGPAWGDDGVYVIGAGGSAGKVLKIQVFTSTSFNTTLGGEDWAKLSTPRWTYTKQSATSSLIITYQDFLVLQGYSNAMSRYQLRVNDKPSDAGENAAYLHCTFDANGASYGATGVWTGVPKGDVTLSVWHRQMNCTLCSQNYLGGPNATSVIVMEIEK